MDGGGGIALYRIERTARVGAAHSAFRYWAGSSPSTKKPQVLSSLSDTCEGVERACIFNRDVSAHVRQLRQLHVRGVLCRFQYFDLNSAADTHQQMGEVARNN